MNSSPSMQNATNICPHVGILYDPQTAMEFPSGHNLCYHVTPPESPGLTHQYQFCLQANFYECELYSAKSSKPLPAVFLDEAANKRGQPPLFRWLLLGMILMVVITAAVWFVVIQAMATVPKDNPISSRSVSMVPTNSPTTQPSKTIDRKPQISPTDELPLMSTVLTTLTVKPASTAIAELQSQHLFKTPFGIEKKFVLHRVSGGETLLWIADKYKTSEAAIRAVNYNMPDLLWENSVLVIPLNHVNVIDVIPMTAYEIQTSGITIQSLAIDQGINLNTLCSINGRAATYILQIGEWVILPHTLPRP